MDDFKIRNCKLCLNTVGKNYEPIRNITRDALGFSLLKLDFDHEEEHIICNICSAKLAAAQKFKLTCLDSDNTINSYAKDTTSPLVLREIYKKESGSEHISDEMKICRLCMKPIKNISDFITINNEHVDMVRKFVPETNIFITKEPVMCILCQDSLVEHCNFLTKSSGVEESIESVSNGQVSNAASISVPSPDVTVEIEDDVEFEECQPEFIKVEYVGYEGTEDESEIYDQEIRSEADSSKVRMYKCETCDYQTKYRACLKRHILIMHLYPSDVPKYKCEHCDYKTKYKKELRRHMKIHKKANIYKCQNCKYETTIEKYLERHMSVHKNIHKCEHCNYECKMRRTLKRHMLTHKHPSEVQMHKCEHCNYETLHRKNLRIHEVIHKNPSEVRTHKCDICGYETMHRRHLNCHMLVHKNLFEIQTHKCEHCNFETKYKAVLKSHMLVHKDPSEVQMYKCHSCSYENMYEKNLKSHMLIHKDPSEVQMYKCEFCDYEARHKNLLKSHTLKHKDPSEVQMFQCEKCGYQTKYKSDLNRHLSRHKSPH